MKSSRRRSAVGAGGLAFALVFGGTVAGTAAHATPLVAGGFQGTSTLLHGANNEIDLAAFEIEPIAPVSVWDIARGGITVNSSGFERNEEVTVTINGESQTVEADFFGELSFAYNGSLAAGSYDVTLSTDAGSTSESFDVIADADFFDEHTQTPLMFATPEVWTDADATAVDVFARYLLADTSIDVLLNGTVIDTIATGNFDSLSFTLTEALDVGQHTLELFHPAVSVSKTIEIVPSTDGAPAPTGDYVGIATQDVAGTTWASGTDSFPLTFAVDADGNITDFTTEYRWVCWLSPDNPTGIIGLDDMPDTRITSDRAFGIGWEASNLDDIYVYGTVGSDGSASGTIFVDTGSCGMAYLQWSAEGDVDPAPVEVTAEAPARDGNTVTIPTVEGVTYVDAGGAELSGTITLTDGQTLTVTATADEGYVLAEGTHEWVYEHEDQTPAPVEVTAEAPARDGNTVTIPTVEGVTYVDAGGAELSGTITLTDGQTLTVTATADEGYVLAEGTHEWVYEHEDQTPAPVEVTAEAPARDGNTVTIPTVEGVTYVDAGGAELSGTITLTDGQTLTVTATADEGYVLAEGTHEWVYEHEDTDPEPEPETIPVAPPSEDDLDAALEGAITAPDEAQAGDAITIAIDGAHEGDRVGLWLFSTPVYLGTQIVDADGTVTVTIPAETAAGDHRVAAWNGADEALIGWDTIAIVAADSGNGNVGDGSGEGNQVNGSNNDEDLAATGSAGTGIAGIAALVLLVAGAGILVLRRRATA